MTMRYRKLKRDELPAEDFRDRETRILIAPDGDEPIAVVLNIEDFRALEATVSLITDPANLRRALAAEERLSQDETKPPPRKGPRRSGYTSELGQKRGGK